MPPIKTQTNQNQTSSTTTTTSTLKMLKRRGSFDSSFDDDDDDDDDDNGNDDGEEEDDDIPLDNDYDNDIDNDSSNDDNDDFKKYSSAKKTNNDDDEGEGDDEFGGGGDGYYDGDGDEGGLQRSDDDDNDNDDENNDDGNEDQTTDNNNNNQKPIKTDLIDSTGSDDSDAPPVKRGRGRPKKSESIANTSISRRSTSKPKKQKQSSKLSLSNLTKNSKATQEALKNGYRPEIKELLRVVFLSRFAKLLRYLPSDDECFNVVKFALLSQRLCDIDDLEKPNNHNNSNSKRKRTLECINTFYSNTFKYLTQLQKKAIYYNKYFQKISHSMSLTNKVFTMPSHTYFRNLRDQVLDGIIYGGSCFINSNSNSNTNDDGDSDIDDDKSNKKFESSQRLKHLTEKAVLKNDKVIRKNHYHPKNLWEADTNEKAKAKTIQESMDEIMNASNSNSTNTDSTHLSLSYLSNILTFVDLGYIYSWARHGASVSAATDGDVLISNKNMKTWNVFTLPSLCHKISGGSGNASSTSTSTSSSSSSSSSSSTNANANSNSNTNDSDATNTNTSSSPFSPFVTSSDHTTSSSCHQIKKAIHAELQTFFPEQTQITISVHLTPSILWIRVCFPDENTNIMGGLGGRVLSNGLLLPKISITGKQQQGPGNNCTCSVALLPGTDIIAITKRGTSRQQPYIVSAILSVVCKKEVKSEDAVCLEGLSSTEPEVLLRRAWAAKSGRAVGRFAAFGSSSSSSSEKDKDQEEDLDPLKALNDEISMLSKSKSQPAASLKSGGYTEKSNAVANVSRGLADVIDVVDNRGVIVNEDALLQSERNKRSIEELGNDGDSVRIKRLCWKWSGDIKGAGKRQVGCDLFDDSIGAKDGESTDPKTLETLKAIRTKQSQIKTPFKIGVVMEGADIFRGLRSLIQSGGAKAPLPDFVRDCGGLGGDAIVVERDGSFRRK